MPQDLLQPTDFNAPGMIDATEGQIGMARALDIGVGAVQNVAQTLNDHLADRAAIAGKLAGTKAGSNIDPNTGELLPIENLPPISDTSIYSTNYRAQALQTYANTAISMAQDRAEQIMKDPANYGQPDKVKAAWDGYTKPTISKMQPMAVGLVQPELVMMGNRIFSQAVSDNTTMAYQDALKGWDNTNKIRQMNVDDALTRIVQNTNADPSNVPGQVSKNFMQFSNVVAASMQQWDNQMALNQKTMGKAFPVETIKAMRLAEEQRLWGSWVKAQSAAFADSRVAVGGAYKPDSDSMGKFLQNTGVPDGVFSGDEKLKLADDAKKQFNARAEANNQSFENQTQADKAAYTTRYGQLQGQFDQAFNQAKIDLDPTAATKLLEDYSRKNERLSIDDNENATRQNALINENRNKLADYFTDIKRLNVMGMLDQANQAKVGKDSPVTWGDGKGTEIALTKQQYEYDKENPNGTMHIADDPAVFGAQMLDDQHGFVYHGGHLPPRIASEFENFNPSGNAQQDANALANFDQLMKNPFAAHLLGNDAVTRMNAWRAASKTDNPTQTFDELTNYGKAKFSYDNEKRNAALTMLRTYDSDPASRQTDLQRAVVNTITSSDTFNTLARDQWGQPYLRGAKVIPEAIRPGSVGIMVGHMSPTIAQELHLSPEGHMQILTDQRTTEAFVAARANAAANGTSDKASLDNTAIGELGDHDIKVSRLLYTDALMGEDARNQLKGTYTLGYGSPEGWYGLPATSIVQAASIATADNIRDMFGKMDSKQLTTFGLQASNLAPPGSPGFLELQDKDGNVRFAPHLINGRMEYDVMLRLQTPNGDQWVNVNKPGTYWHYDMASTGDPAVQMKAAQAGRKANDWVLRDMNKDPFYGDVSVTSALIGQAAATTSAYLTEQRAMNDKYDKARAEWNKRKGTGIGAMTTERLPVD